MNNSHSENLKQEVRTNITNQTSAQVVRTIDKLERYDKQIVLSDGNINKQYTQSLNNLKTKPQGIKATKSRAFPTNKYINR